MFGDVFVLSPLEDGVRKAYGMTIVGVPEREFHRVLLDIRPDLVRAYGGYWPADLACRYRIPGVPVVVSIHDTDPSLLHRSVRDSDLVICVSMAVKRQVLELGTDPARIRLLPNRVDTSVFRPIKDSAATQHIDSRFPDGKHILHVGRLTHQKNVDTLLRALGLLPSDYSCVFIGSGDKDRYASQAQEIGVSDRCFWIDSVENSELPLWYSWCDCMCTPSRSEGFGIVFIEAAACGAGIVTSDIAPMNEYLTDDVSACLVANYENPRALAEAIRKVCEDDHYSRRISMGAVRAAQPFDRDLVEAAEAEIYREAMQLRVPTLSTRVTSLYRSVAGVVRRMMSRRI